MRLGTFTRDQAGIYAGEIKTLTIHREVELHPVTDKTDNGPSYRVIAKTERGMVEFGAAWKRTSKKDDTAFLSVQLDDPALPAAMNMALFDQEDGTAELVWTRKKDDQPKPEAQPEPGVKPKKAKAK
jgi:uncharacterized protein (DUF736 family)